MTRLLAMNEELQSLALSAPDGTVFDACENAVLDRGREIPKRLLEAAVVSRVEAAEKRGPRSASVRAGDGAAWIWTSVQRSLTSCTQTLDFDHAAEHLAKCAERIFGEGTDTQRAAFDHAKGLLLAHGWSGVCT